MPDRYSGAQPQSHLRIKMQLVDAVAVALRSVGRAAVDLPLLEFVKLLPPTERAVEDVDTLIRRAVEQEAAAIRRSLQGRASVTAVVHQLDKLLDTVSFPALRDEQVRALEAATPTVADAVEEPTEDPRVVDRSDSSSGSSDSATNEEDDVSIAWVVARGGRSLHVCRSVEDATLQRDAYTRCGRCLREPVVDRGLETALAEARSSQRRWSPRCWSRLPSTFRTAWCEAQSAASVAWLPVTVRQCSQ